MAILKYISKVLHKNYNTKALLDLFLEQNPSLLLFLPLEDKLSESHNKIVFVNPYLHIYCPSVFKMIVYKI